PEGFDFSNHEDILADLMHTWGMKLNITQRAVSIKVKPFAIPEYRISLTGDRDEVKAFADDSSNVEPADMALYIAERERWLSSDSCILTVGSQRFLLDETGDIVAA
ncbi:MAG: hypothetical protein GYB67_08945, partial [Chloroflexi bacterium]|nr:hypothetical protein [Chloroflexota bacterium]